MFVLVSQCCPNFGGVVFFGERAGGADVDALTAECAVDVVEIVTKSRSNCGVETTVDGAQDVDALDFFADCFAAVAEYAFVGISDDRNASVIDGEYTLFTSEADFSDAHLLSEGLQLTFAAAYAGQAVSRMVGQKQFNNGFSGFADFRCICENFQSFADRIDAGRL